MKLHLPLLLRKSLIAALISVTCLTETSYAGIRHPDVLLETYTDFGQNKGRYVVGNQVNALLQHIRDKEGGITIPYTDGQPDYIISNEQGMINFSAAVDGGPDVAIGPNYLATVAHNGSNHASYSERIVGSEHAMNYQAIDIRYTGFRLTAPDGNWGGSHDYMLQRQSKVQTDVTWNPISSITDADEMTGEYLYHAGGGSMGDWINGKEISSTGAYVYITGGILTIKSVTKYADKGSFTLDQNTHYGDPALEGATSLNPIPNGVRGGDSGSPVWIYNKETKQYEYVAAQSMYSGPSNYATGNTLWTQQTMDSYDVHVDATAHETIYLNAVKTQGETITHTHKDGAPSYTTTIYTGLVTDEQNQSLASFKGLETGLNTWKDLSPLKNTQNWYAYNAGNGEGGYLNQEVKDLFYTENLVFTATDSDSPKHIVLNDTVDLGVGYAEFEKGAFIICSQTRDENGIQVSEGNLFNHSGYVINEGAEVHLRLVNPDDYMTEWRKIGGGDLYIDGTGDTNALLNVGGGGKTYLQQKDGYAAYNVLVNTGATVVIKDKEQIVRDFTFGSGGGTLDMNGNSMEWHQTTDADDRFTINALTEDANIANNGEKSAVLTYMERGNQVYAGSFQDSATGGLKIDYQGNGTWTLNSIHTDLSHHTDSGLIVSNGSVTLVGINTVHGMGSATGRNADCLVKLNDWHYADAAMDVTVKSGATFELGSHARLTGDVTVESGATYIMREGVHSRYEYVEGGARLEDTYQYSAFYGHKGNISLAEDSSLQIAYSEGTTSAQTLAGNITGAGDVSMSLSTSAARLTLEGDNSFSGKKTLSSGGLVGDKKTSLGNTSTHKWVLGERAWIASHADTAQELLDRVDTSSTGTLALSADTEEQLDLSTHQNLYLGAEEGKTVNYGAAGTTEKLEATQLDAEGNYVWKLGGGGGTLNVNYQLSGNHDLLLGAADDSAGFVYLGNAANDFTGNIIFNSEGIKLSFAEGALSNASLNLSYGNGAAPAHSADIDRMSADSAGILLLDNQPGHINTSQHQQLALGSSVDMRYAQNITLAAGQAYRFSVMDGATLTVGSALAAGHDLIIDAQGYTGGTVILDSATAVNGAVSVMGHKDGNGGSITLGLTADDALLHASSVTVQNACVLDIAGTRQTFTNIHSQAGSQLIGTEVSSLVFDIAGESSLNGSIQVGRVEKTGTGTLVLGSADNSWDTFTIKNGTVRLSADNALSAVSTVVVQSSGILDLGTPDNTSSGGNIMRTVGGNIMLDGGVLLTGTAATDDYTRMTGTLSVAAGKTGTIRGNHLELTKSEHNATGGTLNLELKQLRLNSGSAQHIGGTVEIATDMTLFSEAGADDMLKRFDHLNLGKDRNLRVDERTWNTIWQFDKLTGVGNIFWQSDTNHNRTARMIINGTGAFSGSIEMNRQYGNGNRTHQAYLQINGNNALKDATIQMTGGNNSYATLALNADKVQLSGISGNTYTHIMLGEAPSGDKSAERTSAPASTRSSTLLLTGNDTYTFSGTIGLADDTADHALSIVKTGTGTQKFDGAHAILGDVTALKGTLQVANATVYGDVLLADGATLTLGTSYTLGAGKSFTVQADAAATTTATFNSQLVLDGGMLNLDLGRLTSTTAALNLTTGASIQSGMTLNLKNTGVLQAGSTYTLISGKGNWADLAGNITINGLDYLSASLVNSDTGLCLTFSSNAEYTVWNGTAENQTWSSSQFGEQAQGAGSKVVFNNAAGSKNVQVEGSVSVEKAIFNSMGDYRVDKAADGSLVTIGSLEQNGSGTTTLTSAVKVTGNVLINDGTLVLESKEAVQFKDETQTVTGDGILEIDWGKGTEGRVHTKDIHGLQITSGRFNTFASEIAGTQYIGLSSDGELHATYYQSNTLTAELQADGGRITKAGGGTITWNLSTGDSRLDTLDIAEGSVTLNFTEGKLGISQLTGGRKFKKYGNGTLNLSDAAFSTLEVVEGVTNIDGTMTVSGQLSIGKGEVNLTNGAAVTINQYTAGNTNDYNPSVVTIGTGASLTVEGSNDVDETDASLLLAHWKSSASSLVLDGGSLTAKNTRMLMGWNSGGTFRANAGTADLLGLRFSSNRGNADSFILGAADSGSAVVSIGSGGITGMGSNDTVRLGRGTLKATADFTISGNCKLDIVGTGDTGTILDTNGNDVTINTALGGTGVLTKTGSGTLLLHEKACSIGSVVVNGGTLELDGNNTRALKTNVTVNSGGRLAFAGTGADILDWDATGKTITVDGGEVDFGTTRQSMGSWGITLKNGATLTGEGAHGTSAHHNDGRLSEYAASMDIHTASTITVESGANEISANIRLRDTSLTFNVSKDAGVDVSGRIHYDNADQMRGTIRKEGAGSLALSGAAQVSKIELLGGSLALSGESKASTLRLEAGEFSLSTTKAVDKLETAAGTVSLVSTGGQIGQVNILDGSIDSAATGTLRLEKKTQLQVNNQIWGNKNSGIELAKEAELSHGGFVFTNTADGTAVLKTSSTSEQYSISSTNYSLTDGYVKRTGGDATLRTQLINSGVENAGSGVLKVYNSANSLNGVHATTGAIRLFDQAEHHLQELSVGEGLELSAYTGVNERPEMVAELHVGGSVGFSDGATLNANLVLENKTVVDLGGTITLHGALNLQTGLTLSGTVLNEILGLGKDQSCELFTGVTQLNVQQLEQSVTLYNMRSLAEQTASAVSYTTLMDENQVAAGDYFSNLAGNTGLVLSYNSSTGTVSIKQTQAVPEPTTATLSLLALAALAARRRRK